MVYSNMDHFCQTHALVDRRLAEGGRARAAGRRLALLTSVHARQRVPCLIPHQHGLVHLAHDLAQVAHAAAACEAHVARGLAVLVELLLLLVGLGLGLGVGLVLALVIVLVLVLVLVLRLGSGSSLHDRWTKQVRVRVSVRVKGRVSVRVRVKVRVGVRVRVLG